MPDTTIRADYSVQEALSWPRQELLRQLEQGGRFVFFEWCVSFFLFSVRRATPIVYLRPNEWGWVRGLPQTIISVLFGWWGLPWGFIYTPMAIFTNMSGGCDVTHQVVAQMHEMDAPTS